MKQATLPGTEEVVGSYTCDVGRSREHQIPSERVRVMMWGCGFVAGCTCGPEELAEISERPHRLGPGHIVIIGGKNLDPDLWLALDELASGWYGNPELEPVGGGPTPREMREAYRQELLDDAG